MVRYTKRLMAAAVLAVLTTMLGAANARAGVVNVTITDSGGGSFSHSFNVTPGTTMNYDVTALNGGVEPFTDFTGVIGKISVTDNTANGGRLFVSMDTPRNGAHLNLPETLTISATDSSFPGLGGGVFYKTASLLGGSVVQNVRGYAVTGQSKFNGGNTLTTAAAAGPGSSTNPSAFSNGTFTPGGTYSIENDVAVTLSGNGDELNPSLTAFTAATPEPASLALAFAGFAIAGAGAWWRRGRLKA